MFKTATRRQSKLRMTIDGPAGSGKSYTALRLAHELARALDCNPIGVIDTERGSASKYVGENPDGYPWTFDVAEMDNFSPDRYTELINQASGSGYGILIIDSLSHAWEGVGGALEIKDKISGSSRDNNYTAWRQVTPLHNRMVDTILQCPMHVITTMRSRMDYIQEVNDFGKVIGIRKVGMAPIQRPGMEYEFDIVGDIDWNHILTVSKSRCSKVADLKVDHPGPGFVAPIVEWLSKGEAVTYQPAPAADEKVFAPAENSSEDVLSLDDLVTQYGVEAIMTANGGMIPSTSDEISAIATMLSGL